MSTALVDLRTQPTRDIAQELLAGFLAALQHFGDSQVIVDLRASTSFLGDRSRSRGLGGHTRKHEVCSSEKNWRPKPIRRTTACAAPIASKNWFGPIVDEELRHELTGFLLSMELSDLADGNHSGARVLLHAGEEGPRRLGACPPITR